MTRPSGVSKISLMSLRLVHKAIAVCVLLPTTLVAMFWTLLGVPALFDAFDNHGAAGASVGLSLALVAGWFGLLTLWRLYRNLGAAQFCERQTNYWIGLGAGVGASLYLLMTMPGQWLAGWPLVAALYFALRLRACAMEDRARSG